VLLKASSIALPAGNNISLLGMLDQIEMEMYCIVGDFVGAKFRKNVTALCVMPLHIMPLCSRLSRSINPVANFPVA